jgi:hypothetical protein
VSDSVLSAVIGASIATIGLIVAKEGKTSEFRQQWIDGLRNDIATLISNQQRRREHRRRCWLAMTVRTEL